MGEHDIAVHAYVLMGNHVHLLLTPPAQEAVSRAMRNFGQSYVQAFNKRHRRSGTLWQGRFKSCLVDTERYLMTVYRYIELQERGQVRNGLRFTYQMARHLKVQGLVGVRRCTARLTTIQTTVSEPDPVFF